MRHDPIYASASEISWQSATADVPVKHVSPAETPLTPDRLLLACAAGMMLVSVGVTWAVLQTDWLYFPWFWMTVAGQTSLLVGLVALNSSGSIVAPRGSTKPPARIGLGGIAFAISGALWLVLLRAIPDMGSELDLPLVAVAASCSIIISVIVASRTSSKDVRMGAAVYSALVVWGLASIYVGHILSVTEMALSALLLAFCAYLRLGKQDRQFNAAR